MQTLTLCSSLVGHRCSYQMLGVLVHWECSGFCLEEDKKINSRKERGRERAGGRMEGRNTDKERAREKDGEIEG